MGHSEKELETYCLGFIENVSIMEPGPKTSRRPRGLAARRCGARFGGKMVFDSRVFQTKSGDFSPQSSFEESMLLGGLESPGSTPGFAKSNEKLDRSQTCFGLVLLWIGPGPDMCHPIFLSSGSMLL